MTANINFTDFPHVNKSVFDHQYSKHYFSYINWHELYHIIQAGNYLYFAVESNSKQLTCMSQSISLYKLWVLKDYARTTSQCQHRLLYISISVPLALPVSYMCVTEL